ncbi:hypothetical protein B0H11DRAFT_23742 [Mycena galericulata]|nr:hypothetical protein B0H11DRAFT_23742 [Mycena galericulata]
MPRQLTNSLSSLDQLKTALKLVAALSDGAINVPYLRGIAGTAVEIIDIAQAVSKNKEDAMEVARNTAERTSSVLDAFKGKSKADVSLDLQEDIRRYAEKLELVQKILYKQTTKTGFWRRVLARNSNADDIKKCKDILNESFQVFQVSCTLRLHTHLPDLLTQLQSYVAAQTSAEAKLSIIRREELDLGGYWGLDGNTSIMFAEYRGRCVVVRSYGTDKKRWVRFYLCLYLGSYPTYNRLTMLKLG